MPTICLRKAAPESPTPEGYPIFHHYHPSPPNRFVEYLGTRWATAPDPYAALEQRLLSLRGVQHLIVANEAFLPGTGLMRNGAARRALGYAWIQTVCTIARLRCPGVKLWVTDFRPRDLKLWDAIRRYMQAYHVPADGIGIQVHATLLPVLPTHWASPQNIPPLLRHHIKLNRHIGMASAFSEVTCWSDSPQARGDWYQHILKLAEAEGVDWLTLWSPTPRDRWHWKTGSATDAHLWGADGVPVVPLQLTR